MKKRTKAGYFAFFIVMLLLGGCSASQKDLAYYEKDFVSKANDAVEASQNANKVLGEVRAEANKGMKRTEIMNSIDQGKTTLETIRDDISDSPVPKEMEPVKKELVDALNKKVDAYQELFNFYDVQDKSHEQKADQWLTESDVMMKQVKTDIHKFTK
ncbi:hypothetical protein [Aneurinibacillus terranovensis]|uniref:hypothetical protein n=1 Tax=Aneurinibacillus terranovensis TaxID=278991 RepID=UPI0003F7C434|nr:hypothetical protein [Aneurinibacillus terranovensis]